MIRLQPLNHRQEEIMKILEKNIKKLYWINSIESTQFQAVVATIFLLAKGLNLTQLLLLGTFYAISSMIMEIPTGVLGDRLGRKQTLILSSVIEIPATIVVILTNSYLLIAIMYLIFGITASLRSGTDTAIMYDTLKGLGKESEYKKINGKLKWFGSWGGAIGGIVGGLLAQYHLSFAWWAWVTALALTLIVKLTLSEPPKHEEQKSVSYLAHVGQSVKTAFRGDASYFIFYYVFVWLFFWLGYSLWQPYLKLIGLPVVYFGFFYAGVSLVSGFSSKLSHKIEKKIGMHISLLLIPIVLALSFILEAKFVVLFSFLFVGIQALSSGFFSPVLEDYVNKRIPSHSRATILSVQNMLSKLVFAIVSPLVGHAADLYSLTTAFWFMGAVTLIVAAVFFVVYREKAVQSEPVPSQL